MAKIDTYRGKKIDELQKMSIEEFAKIVPARQRRTLLRGFNEPQKKLMTRLRTKTKPVKTQVRSMIIIPEMVGKRVLIHNGKEWITLDINIEMLGYRLGDFALTRKIVRHSSPGVGATRGSKFMPLK
jgi:small subunit ribosomal protein S19